MQIQCFPYERQSKIVAPECRQLFASETLRVRELLVSTGLVRFASLASSSEQKEFIGDSVAQFLPARLINHAETLLEIHELDEPQGVDRDIVIFTASNFVVNSAAAESKELSLSEGYIGHFYLQYTHPRVTGWGHSAEKIPQMKDCNGNCVLLNGIRTSVRQMLSIKKTPMLKTMISAGESICLDKDISLFGVIEPKPLVRMYLLKREYAPYDGIDEVDLDGDLDGTIFYRDLSKATRDGPAVAYSLCPNF
jgi:hypothetical protein